MRELLYLTRCAAGPGRGQVGTVAAGMAFVGPTAPPDHPVARPSSLAVQLAADGTPDDEAAARLLALKGTDRVALEQAARRTAGNPDTGRAPCCSRSLESRDAAVLVTRGMPEPVREHLAERCRLEVWEGEGVMPRAELLDRVAGKAGLMAMLTDRVDAELLDRAGPGLRVVANYAVGHDNLDLDACTARGVLATNTPDVVTEATADLAWALLLAAARRVAEGDRFLRARRPWIWGPEFFLGFEVHGKTLGRDRARPDRAGGDRRAAGFGMPVLYTARSPAAGRRGGRPRRGLAGAGRAAGRGRLRHASTPACRRRPAT